MNNAAGKTMNNFTLRAITGFVFVSCIVGALLFHPFTFWILFGSVTVAATWEFYSLAEKDRAQPQKVFGAFTALVLFIVSALVAVDMASPLILTLMVPLLFAQFIIELYAKTERPFTNIGYTLLGLIYVALPFSLLNFLVFRNDASYSPGIVLGYFIILWSCDTGAYLVGKSFGKHPLFFRISPKKSWEGSIGGAIIGLAMGYVLSLFYTDVTTLNWLIIALIVVVMSAFGDLTESLFKRSIDIKDSGNILPGHGGWLDRFDGLLLSVPFIWAYLMLLSCFKI